MAKKLIKTITETYKKDKIYNLADGHQIPREYYSDYFENSDDDFGGEWAAEDKCIKTVTVVSKIYEYD